LLDSILMCTLLSWPTRTGVPLGPLARVQGGHTIGDAYVTTPCRCLPSLLSHCCDALSQTWQFYPAVQPIIERLKLVKTSKCHVYTVYLYCGCILWLC